MIDKIKLKSNDTAVANGTGYLGGTQRSAADHPYVKGYFYAFFSFPSKIFNSETIDPENARNYILTSAEDYTPPGDRQLNVQDIQGQGGVDSSFLVGQTISREFSIQYKDYWGAPIFRIHRLLTSYINPYLGASTIADKFSANEYKFTTMIIQTKPVARKASSWKEDDIIKVDFYDGVQCLTDLKSVYGSNITDNSFIKPTVQYKFDGFPLDETEPDILKKATEIMNQKDLFKPTKELYNNLISSDAGKQLTTSDL